MASPRSAPLRAIVGCLAIRYFNLPTGPHFQCSLVAAVIRKCQATVAKLRRFVVRILPVCLRSASTSAPTRNCSALNRPTFALNSPRRYYTDMPERQLAPWDSEKRFPGTIADDVDVLSAIARAKPGDLRMNDAETAHDSAIRRSRPYSRTRGIILIAVQ